MMTFCEYCNKFVNTHTKEYEDSIEVKGLPIRIVANGSFCDECENRLFDRNADNDSIIMAYREYRRQKGLLQPEEIKKIREKYGLSQISFSRLLGFGDKTVTRYERGALQDEAPDTLIASADNPQAMISILQKKKERIPSAEYERALSIAIDLLASEQSDYEEIFFEKTSWLKIDETQNLQDDNWEACNIEALTSAA